MGGGISTKLRVHGEGAQPQPCCAVCVVCGLPSLSFIIATTSCPRSSGAFLFSSYTFHNMDDGGNDSCASHVLRVGKMSVTRLRTSPTFLLHVVRFPVLFCGHVSTVILALRVQSASARPSLFLARELFIFPPLLSSMHRLLFSPRHFRLLTTEYMHSHSMRKYYLNHTWTASESSTARRLVIAPNVPPIVFNW